VDGVDYLRKLRVDDLSASEPKPSGPAATPQAENKPAHDRRASPRYACQGSARYRQLDSEIQAWGTFSDVSLHGCYIEVTAAFPVGTMLALSLELNGLRVEVNGEVRVSYPFLGMGIAFREVSEENRKRLAEMVGSLAHGVKVVGRHPAAGKPASEAGAGTTAALSDPRHALEALVEFFDTRALLTREEFYGLLRDSQSHP
jgi:hypothetical protein